MQKRFPTQAAGSRYAFVRQVRERWAAAPRLQPLSYWAVARPRVLNNPQVSARSMLIVLLGIPMGTPGEVALAIAAGWMTALYVVLNLVATVRTAFPAAWWLAPTPLRLGRFAITLTWRALLAQAIVCSAALVIIGALERPRWLYTALAATGTWLVLVVGLSLLACAPVFRPRAYEKARLSRWFR